MVFSAALQEGYFIITLIGIFASVISAVYYLFIIKTMFFENHSYVFNNKLENIKIPVIIKNKNITRNVYFNIQFSLASTLSIIISILTLILLLFIFMPNE
jgi:NADH-ubiquinone oxidoreductase chain 2